VIVQRDAPPSFDTDFGLRERSAGMRPCCDRTGTIGRCQLCRLRAPVLPATRQIHQPL
jgi:hypothetical protein